MDIGMAPPLPQRHSSVRASKGSSVRLSPLLALTVAPTSGANLRIRKNTPRPAGATPFEHGVDFGVREDVRSHGRVAASLRILEIRGGVGRWAARQRSVAAREPQVGSTRSPARQMASVGDRACLLPTLASCRSRVPSAKEEPWSSPHRKGPSIPRWSSSGRSGREACRTASPIRSRHLPVDLRDDQPEPPGRRPEAPCGPGVADGAVRGTAERRADRALQPDPRSEQGDPRADAGAHGRRRRSACGFKVRACIQEVSGTAREEAVGSPPSREGTMSVTMPDPAAHLLNLPAPHVEPPITLEVTTDGRTTS
jgi:hypothetical protein